MASKKQKRTIERVCEICGRAFLVGQYEVKRGRGKCCSLRCAHIKGSRARGYSDVYDRAAESKRYRRKYPDRAKANALLRYYVRMGKLHKSACSNCGTSDDIVGHHYDYRLPLAVVWLCRKCHALMHAQERMVSA
jgi:hypothetical protein